MQKTRTASRIYSVLALLIGEEQLIMDRQDRLQTDHYSLSHVYNSAWISSDLIFRKLLRIQSINDAEGMLFHVKKRRYFGAPISVNNINLRRFDPVLELHMNNKLLRQWISEQSELVGLANKLVHEVKRAMPVLAACITSKRHHRVKAFYSVTLLHRGIERFGFSTIPLENKWSCKILTWYLHNIFRAYNPRAYSLLQYRPDDFIPKKVVISKDQLIQRYGSGSSESVPPCLSVEVL